MDVNGKTAIITGAGSGIGRAIALEFGRHGANVVCCARRKDRLDETVAMVRDAGGTAAAIPTDVTRRSDVDSLIENARSEFGTIDVLFNNAGSFQSIAGVHEVDPDVWWNDVIVNLYGPLLLIREVLPIMAGQKSGVIINMNGGRPVGGSGYASGKAGLMELTRVLSEELKMTNSPVIVVSAGPGLVRTEMTDLQANTVAGQKWIPSTKASFESGKTRAPEDIARATIGMLKVVTTKHCGKPYSPDTDFTEWQ